MLLTPIFTFVWLCLFSVYWVAVAMLVASTDRAELSDNSQVEGLGHAHYVERAEYNYFFWLHIFGGLWALQFIHASQEMTIAGCVTTWYVPVSLQPSPSTTNPATIITLATPPTIPPSMALSSNKGLLYLNLL